MSFSHLKKFVLRAILGGLLEALVFSQQKEEAPQKTASDSLDSRSLPSERPGLSEEQPGRPQFFTLRKDSGRASPAFIQKLTEIRDYPESLELPGLLLDLMQEATLEEVEALQGGSDSEIATSTAFKDEMKAAAYER